MENAGLGQAMIEEEKRQNEYFAARAKLDDSVNGIYYAVRAAQRYLTMGKLEHVTEQIDRCSDAAVIIKKCLPPPPVLSRWQRFQARAAEVYAAINDAWSMAIVGTVMGGVLGAAAGGVYGAVAGKPDAWAWWAAYGAGICALYLALLVLSVTASLRENERKKERAGRKASTRRVGLRGGYGT